MSELRQMKIATDTGIFTDILQRAFVLKGLAVVWMLPDRQDLCDKFLCVPPTRESGICMMVVKPREIAGVISVVFGADERTDNPYVDSMRQIAAGIMTSAVHDAIGANRIDVPFLFVGSEYSNGRISRSEMHQLAMMRASSVETN